MLISCSELDGHFVCMWVDLESDQNVETLFHAFTIISSQGDVSHPKLTREHSRSKTGRLPTKSFQEN